MKDQLFEIFSAFKTKIRREKSSALFEKDMIGSVDHDLRDLRIIHQSLKDIQPSHPVKQRRRKMPLFFQRKIGALFRLIDTVGDDLSEGMIIDFIIAMHGLKDQRSQFRDRNIGFGRLFLFGLHEINTAKSKGQILLSKVLFDLA